MSAPMTAAKEPSYDAAELARLRDIAQKATPGPWRVGTSKGPHSPHQDLIRPCDGDWAENISHGVKVPNAIHMAAFDPPTILALIDELEKAREERDDNKWCKSKLIGMRDERDSARAELDALSASHKDLAHRLARIGEELERERESHEVVLNSYAAENQQFFDRYEKAEAERDSASALLRLAFVALTDVPGYAADLRARIAKELGPTREDEPHSPA